MTFHSQQPGDFIDKHVVGVCIVGLCVVGLCVVRLCIVRLCVVGLCVVSLPGSSAASQFGCFSNITVFWH